MMENTKKTDDRGELLNVIRFTEEVSTKIYRLGSRQEVYRAICAAFAGIPQYHCGIIDVREESGEYGLIAISISENVIRAAEKLTGQKLGMTFVKIDDSAYFSDIIYHQKVLYNSVVELFADLFKSRAAGLGKKLISLFGLNSYSVHAPIIIGGRVIAVIGITSSVVSESMIPSFRSFARHIAAAIELAEESAARAKAENQLQRTFNETRELLRESHHRIRDNLLVIGNLLELQARAIEGGTVEDVLTQVRNRIRAIGFVHEGLSAAADYQRVDLGTYAGRLVRNIYETNGYDPARVIFRNSVDRIDLPVTQLVPFGLVLNELITNALRHGFAADGNREGYIDLRISLADGVLKTVLVNNGAPLPEEVTFETPATFGLQLVHMLVTGQLEGKIDIVREPETTGFAVTFPCTS